MKNLLSARSGELVKIARVDAGVVLHTRLKHLGLLEGDVVRVVQSARGGIIVAKGNLRLAIGRGMSQKILIDNAEGK